MSQARQLALLTLKRIQKGLFADVALNQVLSTSSLSPSDRGLMTELVYGCVRRQRTLDALINQLGSRPAHQQPPDLRLVLSLGLYQLRYLSQIPDSAVVDTSVQLAKQNRMTGLAGVVNGVLRQYLRLAGQGTNQESLDGQGLTEVLQIPAEFPQRLGITHSYPDWIVEVWAEQTSWDEVAQLCMWMNQSPHLDLRINPLRTTRESVAAAMQAAGITVEPIPGLPQALRVQKSSGAIASWPGFTEGWWVIQDASAQLVAEFLGPQPGERIADACAAPGGKSTHIAELMQDQGEVWACDRTEKRLRQVAENQQRLGLQSIQIHCGDSRLGEKFSTGCDRVLLDAPCSGLGTLHRHADARWRQTPESVADLVTLQHELLHSTANWVKPGGILLYATCTLHPAENELQIQQFLRDYPDWQIVPPQPGTLLAEFATAEGWVKIWPHRADMDGFFMAKLVAPGAHHH